MPVTRAFRGNATLDIRDSRPDWRPYEQPRARDGVPNIVLIVLDDVGFGSLGCFGGPVETPAIDRLARNGLRYTNWHTTGVSSATRACLLTGRNHTTVGMAGLGEATSGFPSSSGYIPPECATLAEVLVSHGWNTYAVGKWHLCPEGEVNLASSKRSWPLGRGFERFYGFLGGETSQYFPELVHDNHPVGPPRGPEAGYHLTEDLTDTALQFIRDSKVIAPHRPFFLYFCPGACHAPHQVPREWSDRYRGHFDAGYEEIRRGILNRQKSMGILLPDVGLPPLNPVGTPATRSGPNGEPYPPADWVKPWYSLSPEEQALFARMAEVYAGMLSHADHHIGRLVDFLEDAGELENTVVAVVSGNGASGEGGPDGVVNGNHAMNGVPDRLRGRTDMLEKLGGPETYNHFCTGWAMGFNTPFKMWKRYASFEGGIAAPCVVYWPRGIADRSGIRAQYCHAIDLMPTLLECAGTRMPDTVRGYTQKPIEGISLAYTFEDAYAVGHRDLQFYSMLGTRGIWSRGWKAVTTHPPLAGWGNFSRDTWELYNTDDDRTERFDLAAQHPAKLEELKNLWFVCAGRYGALPLDDRNMAEILEAPRPALVGARKRYVYYPNISGVPEAAAVSIRGRSYTVAAHVEIVSAEAAGVLFAMGGRFGGHALYVKDRRLRYVYNFVGIEDQLIESSEDVPLGDAVLVAAFEKTGEEGSGAAAGVLRLQFDGRVVGERSIRTQPGRFSLAGEGLDVGRDGGDAVTTDYPGNRPWAFTGGTIRRVTVDVSGEPYRDPAREAIGLLLRE